MNKKHVLTASVFRPELPQGLDKGQAFYIADGPANFGDENVYPLGRFINAVLDHIGYMGNHLDGFPEVIAPAFLHDDRFVYPAPR